MGLPPVRCSNRSTSIGLHAAVGVMASDQLVELGSSEWLDLQARGPTGAHQIGTTADERRVAGDLRRAHDQHDAQIDDVGMPHHMAQQRDRFDRHPLRIVDHQHPNAVARADDAAYDSIEPQVWCDCVDVGHHASASAAKGSHGRSCIVDTASAHHGVGRHRDPTASCRSDWSCRLLPRR